jgi:hypothetical protein
VTERKRNRKVEAQKQTRSHVFYVGYFEELSAKEKALPICSDSFLMDQQLTIWRGEEGLENGKASEEPEEEEEVESREEAEEGLKSVSL